MARHRLDGGGIHGGGQLDMLAHVTVRSGDPVLGFTSGGKRTRA